jgi:N-acetylmuramoyl-L-alanine amidase
MESFNQDSNQDPNQGQDQGLDQLEESKIMQDIPQGNKTWSFVKNVIVFLLLVAIIVASFWFSFQLGKKILVPVKKKPARKIEVMIPEPPASIAGLQSLDELSIETEEKPKAVVKEVVKPKVPVARVASTTSYSPATGKYYKVQAGIFTNRGNALLLAGKLGANGFETYTKKLKNGKWRVQAGAFKNKKYALDMQRSLRARGFNSVLIFE